VKTRHIDENAAGFLYAHVVNGKMLT